MLTRRVILWSVLCAAVIGTGIFVHEIRTGDLQTNVEPVPARKVLAQSELQELQSYIEAERIDDPFQRCLKTPNPPESGWDARLIDAACGSWQRKTISYDEWRAAIKQHHPEELQRIFDSYLKRNYEPEQHGFLLWAFDSMFQNWSKEEEDLLDQWIEEDPGSAFARAARGVHFVQVAFHERGTKFASETTREQFARMNEYAAKARKDLEQATRLEPRLSVAYDGLLRVAQLQSDRALLNSSREAALALDPADPGVYDNLLSILLPQWGGSLEQMREVADTAQRQASTNPLLRLLPARIACYQASRLTCKECGAPDTVKQRARQAWQLYQSAARAGPAECVLTEAPWSIEQSGDDIALARYYSQAFRFLGGNRRIIDRSLVLQRLGKADWALEGLDRIIKAYPRAYNAFIYRGYVLKAEQRGAEALQAFAHAYAIAPSNWDAVRNLVDAYDNVSHEPVKAREIVDKMMAERPVNPRAWLLEASLHHAGEEALCRDALKKYLQLVDPKTEDATERHEIERATKRVAELDRRRGA